MIIYVKISGTIFIISLSLSILQQNVSDFPIWQATGTVIAILLGVIGYLIKKKMEHQDSEIEKLRIWKHKVSNIIQGLSVQTDSLEKDLNELKEELK